MKRRHIPSELSKTPLRLETLERRVLFSADLPFLPDILGDSAPSTAPIVGSTVTESGGEEESAQAGPLELVIIDPSADNFESALQEAEARSGSGFQAYLLSPDVDGLAQLSDILTEHRNVSALHLLTAGTDSEITLGGSTVTLMDMLANADEVASWGESFAAESSWQIYGSGMADSDEGLNFVTTLSDLTGTDVAVSSEFTVSAWSGPVATGENPETEAAAGSADSAVEERLELVFIDTDTPDYEQLLDDLLANDDSSRNIEVVVLDQDKDGIEEISEFLSHRDDLDAIHIISHGSDGNIQLGNTSLNSETLADNNLKIALWADSFAETGDILIYGCNLASTEVGQSLIKDLGALTLTDVAASDDLTGHESLGGDWDLEHQVGDIESTIAVSLDAQVSYRQVLADFTVDTTDDTNDVNLGNGVAEDGSGNTSLRAAIEEANALAGADTITIGAGTFTLSGGQLVISSDVTITGAGPGLTIIDGASLYRVFEITNNATVTLEGMTITGGGNVVSGGGISVSTGNTLTLVNAVLTGNDASQGGAIYNNRNLIMDRVSIISNTAGIGGGLFNSNTAAITNSLFYDNTASNDGGGIWVDGNGTSLTLTNTTLSGNTADTGGGLFSGSLATLTNVTITDNTATTNGGGIAEGTGTVTTELRNTIVAGNTSPTGSDIDGSMASLGYNVIGDTSGSSGWTVDDQQNVDPLLGALADNGGPTMTHALQTGSTAIDGGTNTGAPTTDQRGYIETDATMDIGAYQYNAVPPANDAPTFIDGAVGNWNFDEGSGDSVAEGAVGISTATLGSTTGADANDPTWTTGMLGQALQFDGVNDYVEIADAPGIDISGPEFSASLWVKPDRGPGTEDMFFMKGDRQGIGNVNYYLSWKDTGKMTWAFKSDGGFEYIDMDVTLPTVGEWNHIAVVFDRPTVSIYINGIEYTSSVGTGGTSMDKDLVANDEPLWIGAGRDGGSIVTPGNFSAPFSGAIDELALFDRALTDAEVEAIRTSAPPVVTASAFNIHENSANNTVVGTVAANDPDVGDTLTYAITAGNTNGAFTVDNNGVITVANSAALDFETTPVFNLTVEATDDGSPNLSDSTSVTITLNNLNDAPIVSATALSPTWTEGAGSVTVFGSTSIDAVEIGDLINVIQINVTGIADGSAETLVIDGQAIELTDLNSLTTVANGYDVDVSAPGGVASVTITKSGGFTASAAETLIDGLAYGNTSNAPQGAARMVTFALIQDDGGTANGGQNTTAYSLDSTVTTVAVNEAPIISSLDGNPTFIEDSVPVVLDSDVTITDTELSAANNFNGATLTLERNGGASIDDAFGASGSLAPLAEGLDLVVGGTTIGTVTTNSAGTLVLTFDGNATNALVDQAMRQIAYSNNSDAPPASIQIDWTFDDGNSGAQGTGGALQAVGSTIINIAAVNDAPVIAEWFNDAWDTRRSLTINAASVAGDLTNFPVLISLNTDVDLAAQALANGDDILFTAADGTTQLAHEIEFFDETTGELRVWVKTDLSGSADTNIYMYFGNAASGNQENASGVWDDYVGVYHLSESPTGAFGELTDSSGSGNHASTEGAMDGTDSVSTAIGQGLSFDGTNDMLRIPDSASLDSINDEATFSLWVNFVDAADGNHQLIMSSANRYSGLDGYEWGSQGDGDHFFYPDAGTPDGNYNLGLNPFTNNTWHHIAATMDFAAREVKIYVDGTPMTFTYEGVPGNWTNLSSSDDLLFGGNPERAERFFLGMMDEIRIADVARSQEWIQTEVSNQTTPGTFISVGTVEEREDKLTDINEDDFTSPGDSVLSIINSSGADRITDGDAGAVEGIAVTAVDDTNGQWQYDANADGSWLAFGTVSETGAVLLDTSALIRFVPNADYNGSAGDLTFHAWDQSTGSNGNTGVDVSANGGSSAYSSRPFDATLTVLPVADAPTFGGANSGAVTEDVGVVTGNISDSGTLTISDADAGESSFQAATINGNYGDLIIDTAGNWTYTTDNSQAAIQSLDVGETLTDTLTVAAFDGTTHDVVITINGTEDAPTFDSTPVTAATEDAAYSYTITTSDVDGDVLSINGLTVPAWLTLTDNGDGTATLSGTPTNAEVGPHSASLEVSDGSLTGTQNFTLTVSNVNDDPVFTSPANFSVAENVATVGTVTTTDADGGVPQYSLVGAVDDSLFSIDVNSGVLSFNTDPDFESPADSGGDNVYDLTVQVDDGNGGVVSQAITVTVSNVNESGVGAISDIDAAADTVPEDATVGTTVGITAFADDADATDAASYSLDDDAGGRFTVDGLTGAVTVNGALDYESSSSHNITLRATSTDGSTTTRVFSIVIGDVNDNAPVITAAQTFSVNEDAVLNNVVGTVAATDVDTVGSLQGWTITAGNADGIFQINGTSGEISIADPTNLNFEATPQYALTVQVSDGVNTSATETVVIDVNDVNEAPVFDSTPVTAATEDVAYSYTIITSDVDGDVLSINSLTVPAWLTLTDNGDGTATLTGTPTNAEVGDHSVSIEVSDGSLNATQNFTLTVSNVNDDPVITSPASFSVAENSTAVGTVSSTDVDGGAPQYTLIGAVDDGLFSIDVNSGALSFNAAPDFESPADAGGDNVYDLTVQVDDGNGGIVTQAVAVTVTNVNETPVGPISDIDAAADAVAEDATVGTTVGITADATDPDVGDTLSYSLDEDAGGLFTIDSNTGVVTVNAALDYETATSHSITVRATSTDTSFTTQSFTIAIGDVNDNAPVITAAQTFSVNEDAVLNDVVGTVAATDVDTVGSLQGFAITAGNADGIFQINADTGEISIADPSNLNFEAAPQYTLTVQVGDGVYTSATETVVINVNDINEAPNLPILSVATVDENTDTSAGYTVGTLSALDVDAGDMLTFEVVGGLDSDVFSIGGLNGDELIIDDGMLDYERQSSYDVRIRVTDSGGLYSERDFAITVNDLNDAPQPGADFLTVMEDTALVIDLATDLLANDLDPDGDPLTVVGMTQPANGVLMDNLDGTWTYLANTNYTGPDQFQYQVSDASGAIVSATVSIDVLPVNDNPMLSMPESMSVGENTTGPVTAVQASDVDGDPISLQLGGADSGAFTLDAATGEIRFNSAPDFEAPADASGDNQYRLQVTASDGAGGFVSLPITINVNDVNEAPELLSTDFTSVQGYSGSVGSLRFSDPDFGDQVQITTIGGSGANLFSIDPTSGEITQSGDSLPGVYTLEVQLTDTQGATATGTLTITLGGLVTETEDSITKFIDDTERDPNNDIVDSGAVKDPDSGAEETQQESDEGANESAQASGGNEVPGRGAPTEADFVISGLNGGQTSVEASSGQPQRLPDQGGQYSRGAHTMVLELLLEETDELMEIALRQATDIGLDLSSTRLSLSPSMLSALEEMRTNVDAVADQDEEQADLLVQTGAVATLSLTAGFVTWLLRTGSLLATVLSTSPLWRPFDPIPVLVDLEDASRPDLGEDVDEA